MGFPPHHRFPPKRNPEAPVHPRRRGFTYDVLTSGNEDTYDLQSYGHLRFHDRFSQASVPFRPQLRPSSMELGAWSL